MELSLAQLAALTGGTILNGDPATLIRGFAGLREAGPGDLCFFANERYLQDLRTVNAAAVLVPDILPASIRTEGVAFVAVSNPSAAFAEIIKRFIPPARQFRPGVHPAAIIHPDAQLDPLSVCVKAGAVIEAGARIGAGTEIGPLCVVGEDVVIGENCLLHPHVTVYHHCRLGDRVIIHAGAVIGADGFGFDTIEGAHRKIDQVGIVDIANDVEIGANSTVDRARFGRTVIGEGSKIDNQVMIAHNCVIGKHVIIVAQAGVAGSTKVGDHCIIAAQSGIAGHVNLTEKVVVTAQAGVTTCLLKPGPYMGYPAQPMKQAQEQMIAVRNLPKLAARVKALELKVNANQSASGEGQGMGAT